MVSYIGLGLGSGQEHRPVRAKGGVGETELSLGLIGASALFRAIREDEVPYSWHPERKAVSIERGG